MAVQPYDSWFESQVLDYMIEKKIKVFEKVIEHKAGSFSIRVTLKITREGEE